MTGIYIDAVFHSGGVRMAGLIAGFAPNEPALRQAPFDPRFANISFIEAVIKGSLKTASDPVVWHANANKDQPRLAVECLVDLVEWTIWAALDAKRPPDVIVISSHPGVIGDTDVPADMVLLRRADIELIIRRVYSDAPVIGIETGNKYPEIKSIPYGIPQTLQGMIASRHLCALPDGYGGKHDGIPALLTVPSMEEIALVRHCVADASSKPPAVLSIARAKVHFERNGNSLGAVGSSIATAALDKACGIISAGVATRSAETAIRELTGQIKGVLAARHGDYEACEAVLSRLWDATPEKESTAQTVLGPDPYLYAGSLIVRAHIANHRGDVETALDALKKAMNASNRENSLRMKLLRLEAANLAAVATQNRWPFDGAAADEISVMREATDTLRRSIEEVQPLLDCLDNRTMSSDEKGLRQTEAITQIKDPSIGGALGTMGRCCAFLGLHKEAIDCLEHAGEHFISPLDLSLNAHFLLHVELDRPDGCDAGKVNALFNRIVQVVDRAPEKITQSIRDGNLALRFSLDLLLKAMMADVALEGMDRGKWRDAFIDNKEGGLFRTLSGLHSHPTELVGRHAGELLRKLGNEDAARQWFELGIVVGEKGGDTMQRLALFTRRLLDGKGPDLATPIGSVFNPNFEYR
jgi:tetratricopeptide (TPR) repeat protein